MVLGMMRNAMLSFHREHDAPPEFQGKELDMAVRFRVLMAQCLILADYTKPHSNLIECLLLHVQADCMQMREADISVWVLMGVIARLAMRMGYHRDPKIFPVLSPFQAEMRRRVWAFLVHADVLLSAHVTMPSIIRPSDNNVEMPRNLYDDDFDESVMELPPSRPMSEPTPISYLIVKARLTSTFARTCEYVSAQTGNYDTLMEVDAELRRSEDSIPAHLRMSSTPEAFPPPSSPSLAARFSVSAIYHKAQCILHRRYITRARENLRYAYSRRTCIDSAMELLRWQTLLHDQSLPGGALYSCGCSFNSDFLLAGTIVCLDLYHTFELEMAGRPSGDTYIWGVERHDEMLAALKRSGDMWNELRDESMDAWKASSVLTMLLERMSAMRSSVSSSSPPSIVEPQDDKQTAAMTLGLLSTGLTPSPGGGGTNNPLFNLPDPKSVDLQQAGGGGGALSSPPRAGVFSPSSGNLANAPSPFSGINGGMPDFQLNNLDWVCIYMWASKDRQLIVLLL